MELNDLYQEIIIDHNRNPRNFREINPSSCQAQGYNPLCGDKLQVYMQINNNIIEDISFTGHGCAISQASASLMSEALKGKTVHDAYELFNKFHLLLTEEKLTPPQCLGKLLALAGVKEFPARVKCATLAWHTLEDALKNYQHDNIH